MQQRLVMGKGAYLVVRRQHHHRCVSLLNVPAGRVGALRGARCDNQTTAQREAGNARHQAVHCRCRRDAKLLSSAHPCPPPQLRQRLQTPSRGHWRHSLQQQLRHSLDATVALFRQEMQLHHSQKGRSRKQVQAWDGARRMARTPGSVRGTSQHSMAQQAWSVLGLPGREPFAAAAVAESCAGVAKQSGG